MHFAQAESGLLMMVIDKWSLPDLTFVHETFIIIFSPLSSLRDRVVEQLLWEPGIKPGSTHHIHLYRFYDLANTEHTLLLQHFIKKIEFTLKKKKKQ